MQPSLNDIWGLPARVAVCADTPRQQRLGLASMKRQLRTFLGEQIKSFQPDRIIVVERKGTAILRALLDWKADPLPWSWNDVISSSSVAQVPDDYFDDKRILVFDDMMRTGNHLVEVLDQLRRRGLWDLAANNVRVAVFAVHERSSRGRAFQDQSLPHAWFYRDLPTAAYREVRAQIIRMLQAAGSLMLDTEHVEVRLRLHDNISRLLDALSRRAQAVLFHSLGDRTNITVYYEDDQAHTLPEEVFPYGTVLTNIVKKCRIVQREGDEFALIPICYPSIASVTCEWPSVPEDVALFDANALEDGEARFYAVGLLAALHVLRWTLRDLATADSGAYTLSLPCEPDVPRRRDEYTLGHLRVMYPGLDIRGVTQRIARIENDARREGGLLRGRKLERAQLPRFTDDQLREDATQLLQAIGYFCDQEKLEALAMGDPPPGHPHGLTADRIFRVGRETFGWENARISVLFDILIDEAALVPHVERLRGVHGGAGEFFVRTFEPDGEMVSELVRSLTTQFGLPRGL